MLASNSFAQLVPRTVLVEEGTNWRCGPCFTYNPNVDKFLAAHEGSAIHLAYHPDWPGADDPMYLNSPDDNQYRVSTYYGITGVPNVTFDGGTPYVPGYVEQLEASFQERFSVGSPVAITVTHVNTGDSVRVHVVVHPVQDMSGYKQLYLRVAAVEDWVDGRAGGGPGPNGEEKYVHAMREMMGGYRGTALQLGANDQTFDWAYEIRPDYTPERMYEVAFIQSDVTKEVLQAATNKPGFTLQPSAGERWITRAAAQTTTAVNLSLANSTTSDLPFTIRYVARSANQWPLTINGQSASTEQHVVVSQGSAVPLAIQVTGGTGAYMSGEIHVSGTVDGEPLESVFPVKFIAPDVKLALVDISADSTRSASTIQTMDTHGYYYVPLTTGEMSVMNGWSPAEFPEIVAEGNKWIVTGSTKTAIANYVQAGGHMLIEGGEIAFGLADAASSSADRDASFLHNVLRVTYVKDSAGPHTVRGKADDLVSNDFASSNIDIYAQNIDAPNQPDEIKPYNNTSTPIFYYGSGTQVAGVRWESGHSRVVYLAFGLQNLAATDQDNILKKSIAWLQSPYAGVSDAPNAGTLAVRMYPNPVSRMLTLDYSVSEAGPVTITLVDATGEIRATVSNPAGSQDALSTAKIDVSLLPRGAYLCVVRSASGSIVRTIAIQ